MSYNRLRRLAGLNESFTDNERMNHEIEDLIAQQQPGTHHRWSDLLEVIYGAGRHGISREEIEARLEHMYGGLMDEFGESGIDNMLDNLDQFASLVEVDPDGEHFAWKYPTANDLADDEIDPHIHAAIGAQVNLSSQTMAMMRHLTQENGTFTATEIARRLHREAGLPAPMAVQFTEHMLTQFRSMLHQDGDRYAWIEEKPVTKDDTMAFLKGLAANPSHDLPPDEDDDED